jgi:hypothetical protein
MLTHVKSMIGLKKLKRNEKNFVRTNLAFLSKFSKKNLRIEKKA